MKSNKEPDRLDNDYLKTQLIAYIGNKRRLLKFLGDVFSELEYRILNDGRGSAGSKILRFGDCFAGSGAVSRLAKAMGFMVASNDWEQYSEIINIVHLRLSPAMLDLLFRAQGGISAVLSELNSLPKPPEEERYISRYYAPALTEGADYRYERLFYTRENALFIDAVRSRIEQMYPGGNLSETDCLRKCALIAPLLYQAATHANTNGVFKACHKGFGGHGGDALSRIMAPMQLMTPVLHPGIPGAEYAVKRSDAADFIDGRSFDICYLDPPYNQHQYGSNYFMLNTIARWDKPPVPMHRKVDGSLAVKAGIRSDWVETRSDFCYRKTAPTALQNLVDRIDARYIVLSYNTEGIIPFEDLFDILSSCGRTEIFCRDYIIYRGGKQSLNRSNRNVEFQLVLCKNETARKSDRSKIDKVLKARSIISILNESFAPERIRESFGLKNGCIILSEDNSELALRSDLCFRFNEFPAMEELSSVSAQELDTILTKLEYCRCRDKHEETRILMELIGDFEKDGEASAYRLLWASLLNVVRKFAFRKYRVVFEKEFTLLLQLAKNERLRERPADWVSVNKKVKELRKIADLRLKA